MHHTQPKGLPVHTQCLLLIFLLTVLLGASTLLLGLSLLELKRCQNQLALKLENRGAQIKTALESLLRTDADVQEQLEEQVVGGVDKRLQKLFKNEADSSPD